MNFQTVVELVLCGALVCVCVALLGLLWELEVLRKRLAGEKRAPVRGAAASSGAVAMAEQEVKAALAVPERHPVFRAVLSVIDNKVREATLQVSDHNMVAGESGALPVVHVAGGIEWLADLRDTLHELREAGEQQAQEEELAILRAMGGAQDVQTK